MKKFEEPKMVIKMISGKIMMSEINKDTPWEEGWVPEQYQG